jgi:hypothetical protein
MEENTQRSNQPLNYQIRIQGFLKEKWADWLNGIVIKIEPLNDGSNDTNITVTVPDQAALRGILNKLWDLNLTLISLTQIKDIQ